MKTVIFPDGLNLIEGKAFYNCLRLESIDFPNNVFVMHSNVFQYCRSLSLKTKKRKSHVEAFDDDDDELSIKSHSLSRNEKYKQSIA